MGVTPQEFGQWRVTDYGMETLDASYSIAKEDLWESDWPKHIRTTKNPDDQEGFLDAYRFAIIHFYGAPVTARDEKVIYRNYLHSDRWQAVRKIVRERDQNRCVMCNGTHQLDVHHRTYERLGHELLSDLSLVCRRCHEKHHGDKVAK